LQGNDPDGRLPVKFLDEKSNFEFLAENNLFAVPLKHGTAGGKGDPDSESHEWC